MYYELLKLITNFAILYEFMDMQIKLLVVVVVVVVVSACVRWVRNGGGGKSSLHIIHDKFVTDARTCSNQLLFLHYEGVLRNFSFPAQLKLGFNCS